MTNSIESGGATPAPSGGIKIAVDIIPAVMTDIGGGQFFGARMKLLACYVAARPVCGLGIGVVGSLLNSPESTAYREPLPHGVH